MPMMLSKPFGPEPTILINGVHIPIRYSFDGLRRFIEPAFFYTKGNEKAGIPDSITAVGTCLKFRYRRRYFRVTCKHVATNLGFNFDAFAHNWFDLDTAKWTLSLASHIYGQHHIASLVDSPGDDCLMAVFDDIPSGAKQNFLDVDDAFFMSEETQRQASTISNVNIGYPTSFVTPIESKDGDIYSIIGWDLKKHSQMFAHYVDRDSFDDNFHIPMNIIGGFGDIDPDGLSGSPMFHVYRQNNNFNVGLNGIVSTANRNSGRINLFPARAMKIRIDNLFDPLDI